MDANFDLKDVLYITGILITIAGSYFAIKYQGVTNATDIQNVKDSNEEQWKKIDINTASIAEVKERIALAIDMETAEKKFVTRELFELTIKQFTMDIEQTKAISQNTLDAVQTLTSTINSNKGES